MTLFEYKKINYDYLSQTIVAGSTITPDFLCLKNEKGELINNDFNKTDAFYKKYDQVVLSCYMTSKKDPQRHLYHDTNNYDYIKCWYESVIKHDLHAIIFYDTLSNEFIEKYQTEKIIFRKCILGKYSINDERYIIYYKYLLNNPYKYVLMTDISDVIIHKNPFELIMDNTYNDKIFVGTNVVGNGPITRTPEWFQRREWKINPFNEKIKTRDSEDNGLAIKNVQIYSAGLLGSIYDKIMWFLENMISVMYLIDSTKNYNMIIFNYIIQKYLLEGYDEKTFCTKYIYTGAPFNSIFGKYEKQESICCLIHK